MAWEKKASQSEAVKAFLVTVDGKVDLDASVDKFRSVALRTLANQSSEDELIVTSINGLFDKYPGASLGLEYVKSQTVQIMAKTTPELGDPGIFSVVSARVEEVLHILTDKDEVPAKGDKPAVPAVTGRAFTTKRGKGGGWIRKSDQPK